MKIKELGITIFVMVMVFAVSCGGNGGSSSSSGVSIDIPNHEAGVDIGSITVGEEPESFVVTITNNTDNPTGDITITITGDDADKFSIVPDTLDSIDAGDSDSFEIITDFDLEEGIYTAIVTITCEDGTEIEFEITFTVGLPTVTFITNGGNHILAEQIAFGEKVAKPANPTRSGYVFDYWYLNGIPYYFGTPVTGNITLEAKWVSNTAIAAMVLKEMVWIHGGTFKMGSPSTEPSRQTNETYRAAYNGEITLSGYWMGIYPVTQAQYRDIMGTNPSSFTTPVAPEINTNRRPVENVNWYDVIEFCNKLSILEELTPAYILNGETDPALWGVKGSGWNSVQINPGSNGYRLPTEAQWEYACRAGTQTPFWWGSTIDSTRANYSTITVDAYNLVSVARLGRTSQVDSYDPNDFGLYDMHGNVWEWCWDWYNDSYAGGNTDPMGSSSGLRRVYRGGGCTDVGQNLRSAFRNSAPGGGYGIIGFRLVRPEF